jgi:hypothetical protein
VSDCELFFPLPCIPNPVVQVLLRAAQQRDFFVLFAAKNVLRRGFRANACGQAG